MTGYESDPLFPMEGKGEVIFHEALPLHPQWPLAHLARFWGSRCYFVRSRSVESMATVCITCLGYRANGRDCFSVCGDKSGVRLVANVVPFGFVYHGRAYGSVMPLAAKR